MIKYDEFLEEYYWYWLNNIRNIGRRKISKLLKRFDSPIEALSIRNETNAAINLATGTIYISYLL